MDAKKVLKTTGGVAFYSVGVAAALIKYDLHVADVVLSGAKNLANHFVNAPDLKIGTTLMADTQKGVGKISKYLMKKGKELID